MGGNASVCNSAVDICFVRDAWLDREREERAEGEGYGGKGIMVVIILLVPLSDIE